MMAVAPLSGHWSLERLLDGFAESVPSVTNVGGLTMDSRRVQPGTLFLACGGACGHGLDFAEAAIKAGVAALAWEPDARWPVARVRAMAPVWGVPVIPVEQLRMKAGAIAERYFGYPSRCLNVMGITGTNGKTSCSHYLAQSIEAGGDRCGVIGTLGAGLFGKLVTTGHTTPDAVSVHASLAELYHQGAGFVAMEVSSHGLDQGRVAGVDFDLAVFTNLSQDHLDYHGDMQHYGGAKEALFRMPGLRCAIINADDPLGQRLLAANLSARETVAYGLGGGMSVAADYYVRGLNLESHAAGLTMDVESSWGGGRLRSSLLGRFNASNLLAVLSVLVWLGVPLRTALTRLEQSNPVPGRMEAFGGTGDKPLVVVDYAHTPDALQHVLLALRKHGTGRVWCVFGCGGERDRGKRPMMGEIAERCSDRLVVTDDNPRREDGGQIIAEILAGMSRPGQAQLLRDRSAAIRHAVAQAAANDVVLVAGKGHEDYQQVGDLKLPFRDTAVVAQALHARGTVITGSGTNQPKDAGSVRAGDGYVSGMRLSELVGVAGGQRVGADVSFSSVSTDTRTLERGDLFVALKGPNFDARDYVGQAHARGAVAAVMDQRVNIALPQVIVADTRLALAQLAAAWRARYRALLVAVTGSNGKTTIKEMLAAILSRRGRVLATRGNRNNDIGVPLTLLELGAGHQFAVVEMGANHPGEIAQLSALARPDVAVISNAGRAHLGGFGSLEAVARAKGEIFSGFGAEGTAVINADDPFQGLWRGLVGRRRILSFGLSAEADVRSVAQEIEMSAQGSAFATHFPLLAGGNRWEVMLPLAGRHNVINALAAAAVALALGLEGKLVQAGLRAVQPVKGRLQPRTGHNGARIIDDSYNANPSSLVAALEVCAACPGEKWLVLGDMGELGSDAVALHGEIGDRARAAGVDRLFTVGKLSQEATRQFGTGASHYSDQDALIEALAQQIHSEATVLIKGSRSQRMERVSDALSQAENG